MSFETPSFESVEVGDALPQLSIDITPSLIVGGAIASRDFTPVHHDVAAAQAQGMQNVFMNILTTNGLVGRYVTDWAGAGRPARRRLDQARRAQPARRHHEALGDGEVQGRGEGRRRGGGERSQRLGRSRHRNRDRHPAEESLEHADHTQGRSRHRRNRSDRVLQELGSLRGPARIRGREGGARRRRPHAGRRGRDDHLHARLQRRDRGGARRRDRRPDLLQPHSTRRRRRDRRDPPGGDGDRHGQRRGGGLLPGAERPLRPALQLGRVGGTDHLRHDPLELVHALGADDAGQLGGHVHHALHARVRRHERRPRPGGDLDPKARRQQPPRLLLRPAAHPRGSPELALDRGAVSPLRLLPGDRRRLRLHPHQPRARPGSPAARRADPRRRPGRRRPTRR